MKEKALFIRQDSYYYKILLKNISYIEASRNYCHVHLQDESKLLLSIPLLKAGENICSNSFIRINRSCIINIDLVDAFSNNTLHIGNKSFFVTDNYRKKVFKNFLCIGNNKLI